MKVAVIGTGSAGMHHMKALRSLDDVEPIAVPLRSSRLAELEAEGYQTAPDIHAAVSQGAGAAVISTDTGSHLGDALTALQAGVDVLVEKPVAIDALEARRLCDEAERLERRVCGGCVLRFSRSLNTFRQLLHEVGCLHKVQIEGCSYLPHWRPSRPYLESYSARANEGGILRDHIHEIDYAGWLFGWPTTLQGRLSNLGRLGIQAEETAELTWETQTDCLISINVDYLTWPPRRSIVARGQKGTIVWDGIDHKVELSVQNCSPREIKDDQTPHQMFMEQDRAFLALPGTTSDRVLSTGEDGVKALAVCDAVRKASELRQEVTVEYV